jgi:hypothetical protein
MRRFPTSRDFALRLACAVLVSTHVLPAAAAAAPRGAVAPRTAVIERIALVDAAPGVRLEIEVDRELTWTVVRDAAGHLAIELPNARPGLGVVSRVVADGLVTEIRLASVGVPSRPVTRIVVVTRGAADHRLAADGGRLRLELVPTGLAFPAPAPPRRAAAPAPSPRREPPPPAPAPPVEAAVAKAPAAPTPAVAPAAEVALLPVAAAPAPAPLELVAAAGTPLRIVVELPPQPVSPPAPDPSPPAPSSPAEAAPAVRDVVAPSAPAPPVAAPAPPLRAVASELTSVARLAAGVLAVAGDGAFEYTGFRLENPERFVLDLHGVINRSPLGQLDVGEGVLLRVRVSQYRKSPTPVTRVIFDLRTPTVPAIESAADGLLVRFGAAALPAAGSPPG